MRLLLEQYTTEVRSLTGSVVRCPLILHFDGEDHIQAIANTAAVHFGSIERGGSSLYPALGVKVNNPEVLQIIFGIGGDEVAHFLEWVDFAGAENHLRWHLHPGPGSLIATKVAADAFREMVGSAISQIEPTR